jgi:hypothetical protein
MNTIWKSYIHIVLSGLSVVLIIGGLLWFFLVETSPESALAIVGGLLSLFGWFQTREDKKDQAEDKAEIINAIRAEKHKIPVEVEGYKSDKHREADIRLFKKLWTYLNDFEDVITYLLHFELIEKSRYKAVIESYIELRERKGNSFIHEDIEVVFKSLDQTLDEFESERVIITGLNRIPIDSREGPIMIVANCKFMRLEGPRSSQSYLEFNRIVDIKLKEWNKFGEKSDEIDQHIAKIVKTVKIVLPEIEFD